MLHCEDHPEFIAVRYRTDSCFKLGYHGFGILDKAVRPNAAFSISHDHVEDFMIAAPGFCDLKTLNCPESVPQRQIDLC